MATRDGTVRYGMAGGNKAASGGATVTVWQVTAGAFALWIDFNLFATAATLGVAYRVSTAITLTSATTATIFSNDPNFAVDSGVLVQAGYASAPSADAPAMMVNNYVSCDWIRGIHLPPAGVLSIWATTTNSALGAAIRFAEARFADNGIFIFGPRFAAIR